MTETTKKAIYLVIPYNGKEVIRLSSNGELTFDLQAILEAEKSGLNMFNIYDSYIAMFLAAYRAGPKNKTIFPMDIRIAQYPGYIGNANAGATWLFGNNTQNPFSYGNAEYKTTYYGA